MERRSRAFKTSKLLARWASLSLATSHRRTRFGTCYAAGAVQAMNAVRADGQQRQQRRNAKR
jgi:hypothetical protein